MSYPFVDCSSFLDNPRHRCLDPEAACLGDDDEFSIGNYENELPMGNYDDDFPIGTYGDDTRVGYSFGDGPSTDGFYGADISYGVVDGCGFAPGIGKDKQTVRDLLRVAFVSRHWTQVGSLSS